MIVLRWLWAQVQAEPVAAQAVVQTSIALLTAFGLHWTGLQVGATLAWTAQILSFLTRKAVTPNAVVESIRLNALYTPVPAIPPQ